MTKTHPWSVVTNKKGKHGDRKSADKSTTAAPPEKAEKSKRGAKPYVVCSLCGSWRWCTKILEREESACVFCSRDWGPEMLQTVREAEDWWTGRAETEPPSPTQPMQIEDASPMEVSRPEEKDLDAHSVLAALKKLAEAGQIQGLNVEEVRVTPPDPTKETPAQEDSPQPLAIREAEQAYRTATAKVSSNDALQEAIRKDIAAAEEVATKHRARLAEATQIAATLHAKVEEAYNALQDSIQLHHAALKKSDGATGERATKRKADKQPPSDHEASSWNAFQSKVAALAATPADASLPDIEAATSLYAAFKDLVTNLREGVAQLQGGASRQDAPAIGGQTGTTQPEAKKDKEDKNDSDDEKTLEAINASSARGREALAEVDKQRQRSPRRATATNGGVAPLSG